MTGGRDRLREFLRRIPKSDLHVHLDGSLRLPTLIELSRRARLKLPSYTEEGLRRLVFKKTYRDLPDYLHGFAFTCAVLRDLENLERVSRELAEDNIAEGVRYVEPRFAPQLLVSERAGLADVIRAVDRGFAAAQRRHNAAAAVRSGNDLPFHYGIIVCAMRRFKKGMSPYFADVLRVLSHATPREAYAAASLELARAAALLKLREGLPIVGFDLAGEESGFPAVHHRQAYQHAHDNFIKKTVHAGEAYGPESIFQAITQCHANRVGHGTFLFAEGMIHQPDIADRRRFVAELSEYIASQRIGIEACVTSNLQTTPAIGAVARHPVKKMIERGLSVSLCTDNRLVSDTTVTRELTLVAEGLALPPRALRNLVIAGFKGSFFPGSFSEKRAFVAKVVERYGRIEAEVLGSPGAPARGRPRGASLQEVPR